MTKSNFHNSPESLKLTTRQFMDAYARCTIHGWLTCEEALLLVAWADMTKGPMVEVGCYMGRSAMLLAQLRDPVYGCRKLYCVDPWDDSFSTDYKGAEILIQFRANINSLPNQRVEVWRTRVEDWKPVPVEFVYLDGDHTYDGTLAQVNKAIECCPKVIAIHDVCDEGGGKEVRDAATSILGRWTERVGRLAVWSIRG